MTGSQLADFKRDPVAFLNAPNGKGKNGLNLTVSGADGVVSATGTVAVANAPRAIKGGKNYASFDTVKFPPTVVDFYLALSAEAGVLNVAKDTTGTTQQVVKALYLNWAKDKAYWMKLDAQGAQYFFTARQNGCGVLIYGSRTAPTVVHANVDMNNLLASPAFDNPQATKEYEAKKKEPFVGTRPRPRQPWRSRSSAGQPQRQRPLSPLHGPVNQRETVPDTTIGPTTSEGGWTVKLLNSVSQQTLTL